MTMNTRLILIIYQELGRPLSWTVRFIHKIRITTMTDGHSRLASVELAAARLAI